MNNELTVFTHERITEHLFLIAEGLAGKRVVMGLAVGEKAALLMDAGLGINDCLRGYIEEEILGRQAGGQDSSAAGLFPLYCACTCGHTRHLGSAKLFDRAYLNRRDQELAYTSGLVTETRRRNLKDFAGGIPQLEAYLEEHFMENQDTVFRDYDDGCRFDLGGISLEVKALPGHTPGSVVFFCPEEHWVFAGASIAQHVSLKTLDRAGMMAYKTGLERLADSLPEDVKIWFTGQIVPMRKRELGFLALACEEVLSGRTLNDLPGESFFSDNRNREEMRAHFTGNCSIAYSADLLGEKRSLPEDFVFYSHDKVSEHVYVLAENNARDDVLTLGLIVGTQRALLVDTGMGMNGQLKKYVESIIGSRPLTAVSTHGNIDHLGGSIMFSDRRLNERDWGEVGRATGTPRRFGDIGSFCRQNEEVLVYCRKHWVNNENMEFRNIEAGEVFDLGGMTVEVLYSGGHTPGHLSYYIPEEKILFSGDAICRTALLRRLNREEFAAYADLLDELCGYIDPETKIYFGHLNLPQDLSDVRKQALSCRGIAAGQTENDPPCNVLRPDKPGGLRHLHFHGNHGVIYEPGNLGKEGKTIVRKSIRG